VTETEKLIEVVGAEPSPTTLVVYADDGKASLNEAGFKRMVVMFVLQNLTESAWTVLKAFDYDRHLNLIPREHSLPKLHPDQMFSLSPAGVAFLEGLWDQFQTDYLLASAGVTEIFRVTQEGRHPFGPLFPFNTQSSTSGRLQKDAWMSLWRMLAVVDPAKLASTLFGLGFGLQFDLDAGKAVVVGPRRKGGEAVVSRERRLFVVGSKGVGKTTLIQAFLNRTDPSAVTATEEVQHYVRRAPQSPKSEVEEAGVTPAQLAARPSTLVVTEYPADSVADALEDARDQCDALIIVVDPSSSSSAAYCESALAGVPDNVPCLVVACPRGSVPSSGLQSTCDSLEVDLFDFLPGQHATAAAADIFRFAAIMTPDPHMNNPQTPGRRAAEASRVVRGKLKLLAGVALVVTSLTVAVAVIAQRRGARIPLLSSLRAAVTGGGGSEKAALGQVAGGAVSKPTV